MAHGPLRTALGRKSDPAAATDTGTFSLIALVKRLQQKFTTQLPSVLDTDRLKVIDSEASGKLSNILTTLQAQIDFSESLWTDDSGAYYVRRVTEDETTHVITVIYTDPAGATVTPGAGLRPLNGTDKELQTAIFDATAGGTGYSTGDILARILIIDTSASPITATAIWMNVTTGAVISAPTGGTYVEVTQNVKLAAGTATIGKVDQNAPNAGGALAWFTQTEDGKNATQGLIADAAVVTDANGTVSAKLRGLVKIFADVWVSASHWLLVDVADRAARVLGSADLNGLTGASATQVTVGTGAVQLDTAALANRRAFSVKALKANTGQVYIGFDNTVTTSGATGGYELDKQEGWDAELTTAMQVWAIASAAGQVVCLAQVAK